MKRITNRRILAMVAGLTVFGAVFAFADSLGVTSTSLGAGSDSVASCQGDSAVTTSYDTAYVETKPGYEVTTVHVTGIATPACDGKLIKVTLAGADHASLAEHSATLATPAADPTELNFSVDDVLASDVTDVYVVITG